MTNEREVARATATPTGESAQARGGELLTTQHLEEIRTHLAMEAFDLRKLTSLGDLPHRAGLALDRMADWDLALVRAIEELQREY